MDADIWLATGRATPNRSCIFAQLNHHSTQDRQMICRLPAQRCVPGEKVEAQSLKLPQVPRTAAVLGMKPGDAWGLCNGVNEHQVALGTTSWRSRLASAAGVLNTDLVRLALERCTSARQALDFITDIVTRHGQTTVRGEDSIFTIIDPHEAYLLETAGSFWAWTECCTVRAISSAAMIRQDWQRLAPGAAEHLVDRGWWECDGSKVNFVGCLTDDPHPGEAVQKRWSRATYLLEEQNGRIDSICMRYLLADPFGSSAQPGPLPHLHTATTCTNYIAELPGTAAGRLPVTWVAFGPPHLSIFVPLFVHGELPSGCRHWHPGNAWIRIQTLLHSLAADAAQLRSWQRTATRLQTRIDQETCDFLGEIRAAMKADDHAMVERQTTLFMQNHVELLENFLRRSGANERVAEQRLSIH